MATLLKSDGNEVKNVDISTLEKMQELVGGYIELVYLPNKKVFVVNEEGLLDGLPFNHKASYEAHRHIVGDVILAKQNEIK